MPVENFLNVCGVTGIICQDTKQAQASRKTTLDLSGISLLKDTKSQKNNIRHFQKIGTKPTLRKGKHHGTQAKVQPSILHLKDLGRRTIEILPSGKYFLKRLDAVKDVVIRINVSLPSIIKIAMGLITEERILNFCVPTAICLNTGGDLLW